MSNDGTEGVDPDLSAIFVRKPLWGPHALTSKQVV
jgi:hypothetical protein